MKYLIAVLACAAVSYGGSIAGGTHIQTYSIGVITYLLCMIIFNLRIYTDDNTYV